MTTEKASATIREELETIRLKNSGMISPEKVVEFARNPDTALHDRFEWDNSLAAHQHRLWQARQVIRVYVTVMPGSDVPVRAYVSLINDRGEGGYRAIGDVMAKTALRESLLEQARADMELFAAKYANLKALRPVIREMKRALSGKRKRKQRAVA